MAVLTVGGLADLQRRRDLTRTQHLRLERPTCLRAGLASRRVRLFIRPAAHNTALAPQLPPLCMELCECTNGLFGGRPTERAHRRCRGHTDVAAATVISIPDVAEYSTPYSSLGQPRIRRAGATALSHRRCAVTDCVGQVEFRVWGFSRGRMGT